MKKTICVLAMVAMTGPVSLMADVITSYKVTWDTSPLQQQLLLEPGLEIYFGAQLTDGGGISGNTTIVFTNFDLGLGMALPSKSSEGSVLGDLYGNIWMQDNSFFNGFLQRFLPGEKFNFRLNVGFFPDPGPFPDAFNFGLYRLNPDGFEPFYSYSPFGNAANADFTDPFTIAGYDTFLDDNYIVPAPRFEEVPGVPEPATWTLLAIGACLMGMGRYRRQAN
ncbi:MAG: PEP-CTERM sorting domain-containing protein [Bryobacteraceae bacterium]